MSDSEKRQYDEKGSALTIKQRRILIFGTMFVCAGLIIGGFFVPPMGIIDGSVLTAVGELGAFGALFSGFESNWGFLPFKKNGNEQKVTN
jgi:hypothetical protein